jgi:hypothetical protein
VLQGGSVVETSSQASFNFAPPDTGGGGGPKNGDKPTKIPTPIIEATSSPVSTGRLEVTHPLEMVVGEADVVTLEIIANPQLARVGVHPKHVTGVISIESDPKRKRRRFETIIKVYPIMSAELMAEGFEKTIGDTDSRRNIVPTHSAVWMWNLQAKETGTHRVTINIFGETTFNGEDFTVVEMSRSFDIKVLEQPMHKKALDNLFNNFTTVISVIVSTGGPLGLIIAYLEYKSDQEIKKLKEKIKRLEGI